MSYDQVNFGANSRPQQYQTVQTIWRDILNRASANPSFNALDNPLPVPQTTTTADENTNVDDTNIDGETVDDGSVEDEVEQSSDTQSTSTTGDTEETEETDETQPTTDATTPVTDSEETDEENPVENQDNSTSTTTTNQQSTRRNERDNVQDDNRSDRQGRHHRGGRHKGGGMRDFMRCSNDDFGPRFGGRVRGDMQSFFNSRITRDWDNGFGCHSFNARFDGFRGGRGPRGA